jgi:hypothetical protein
VTDLTTRSTRARRGGVDVVGPLVAHGQGLEVACGEFVEECGLAFLGAFDGAHDGGDGCAGLVEFLLELGAPQFEGGDLGLCAGWFGAEFGDAFAGAGVGEAGAGVGVDDFLDGLSVAGAPVHSRRCRVCCCTGRCGCASGWR